MFVNNQNLSLSLKPLNFLLWFILAFQAGTINVGGFLTCRKFVTHVTGYATHFGVDLAHGSILGAFSILTVPMSFLFGAIVSGLIIDRRKFKRQTPWYTFAFFFSSICFLGLAIFGKLGLLGEFGQNENSRTTLFLLMLLSFLSGLQNGMISLASGLLVRTTHLTGITTDLGLGIVRMFYPKKTSFRDSMEFKLNLLRFGTIASFIFGSVIAGIIFVPFQYLGFLLPWVISVVLTYESWKRDHEHMTPLNPLEK